MINRTYQDVKKAHLKRGFKFFENGQYNLNISLERTSKIITNRFDDYLRIAYKDEHDTETCLNIIFNTKPGINKGTISMVVDGQYPHCYRWVPKGGGVHGYPFDGEYFELITNLNIWLGCIDKIDFSRVVITIPELGTDIHKQSAPGVMSTVVGPWSLACSGAPEPEFRKIIPIMNKAVEIWKKIDPANGDKFTVTWLNSQDYNL